MESVWMYLLKMLICSAVLFAYYRLALYNERFHQWDRFYLLATLVLSVIVPFISVPVTANRQNDLINVFSSLPWNGVAPALETTGFVWQDVVLFIAVAVSIVCFLKVAINIAKIIFTYRSNPVSEFYPNIRLVITKLTSAPFSFFNWLFWRKDIDPASAAGQRMLAHELAHIQQHHSIDKLFTSLLLCVFWMNPFFWLIKRELSMIHEFLADKKAVEQHDGAALAEMILQALPIKQFNNGLINPFFSSQIKRRLLMITQSKDPKYTYLRRLSALVIMICSVFAMAVSVQHAEAQQKDKIVIKDIILTKEDTTKKKVVGITFPAKKTPQTEKIIIKDVTLTKEDSTVKKRIIISSLKNEKTAAQGKDGQSPLFILDGKEIDESEMQSKDPNTIKEINVLKGESAINKYGEKGKNGVLEIKSKSANEEVDNKAKVVLKSTNKTTPLYFLDGNELRAEELEKIDPNKIESINVLKGENAIKKYGEKAKDGVVEIKMKKPVT